MKLTTMLPARPDLSWQLAAQIGSKDFGIDGKPAAQVFKNWSPK